MEIEDRSARLKRLYREEAEFAEDSPFLSDADVRTTLLLLGIGALSALACISIGIAVVRLLL
ncbi:hypothetical protein GIW70_13455 [Pseudomonas syringae]|nr:hypothetical protein [Pseudomonas syringae]MCF5069191.1 hypothetical protein [Pseudomonas syringae]